jgi:DivIVA domain-containing protein
MDGTPQFLTDVKFAERRKGYDPEQVDNYLSQISDRVAQLQDMVREATARADEAEAKISEAKRARSVAEAQVDKLRADVERLEGESASRPVDEQAEVEHASKVLLMAQKTADATVEDANRTAGATLADAQREAAAMLAAAESDAANLRGEAKRQIDELVQQRRTEILSEVSSLEKVRDDVAGDVSALEQHLETQRANLRSGVEALKRLLDDPASLRSTPPPALSDASLSDIEHALDADVDVEVDPDSDSESHSESDEVVIVIDETIETEELQAATEADAEVEAEAEAEAEADADADGVEVVDLDQSETVDEHQLAHDPEAEFPPVKLPELLNDVDPGATPRTDIDLTTERLFESRDEPSSNGGPPTELFTPFSDDTERDDPLGQPDDEADAAMRAFFEADFDSETEPKKSRWRR